jgi:hypothetical protein
MEWSVLTVLIYLAAVPFTIIIFPENNVWIAILVIFAGLTDALNSLADRMDDEDTHEIDKFTDS